MGRATLDQNFRHTLIGVDHLMFVTPTEAAVKTSTHELLTVATSNETAPTDSTKLNPSLGLAYDANGNLSTLTMTTTGGTYTKSFTWTSGNLTNISSWS